MGRLSDKAMVELGRQYVAIRAQLLAELKARDVSRVERDGVKIARRINRTKHYDVALLAKSLTRKVSAKVITRRVDGWALHRALKAGEVDQATVDAALLSIDESAPFLEVTVRT